MEQEPLAVPEISMAIAASGPAEAETGDLPEELELAAAFKCTRAKAASHSTAARRSSGRCCRPSTKFADESPKEPAAQPAEPNAGKTATKRRPPGQGGGRSLRRTSAPAAADSGIHAARADACQTGAQPPATDAIAADNDDAEPAVGGRHEAIVDVYGGMLVSSGPSLARERLEAKLQAAGLDAVLASSYLCGGARIKGEFRAAFQQRSSAVVFLKYRSIIDRELLASMNRKVASVDRFGIIVMLLACDKGCQQNDQPCTKCFLEMAQLCMVPFIHIEVQVKKLQE